MASYPTATAYPAASDADVPMGTIATGVPVAARVVAPPATLASKGFPAGLYGMLQSSVQAFPIRFVVVDNSGSMNSGDGSRLMKDSQGNYKVLRATRWQELCDTLISLSEISTSLGARTDFHLLNPGTSSATPPGGGQYLSLCTDAYGFVTAAGATVDHAQLSAFFKGLSPTGTTPLAESLHQIISTIQPVAEKMRHNGQKAVVVIATDGLPNDKNAFLRALQQLQALPVFPIVRLCTNDDNVVQYYSDLDKSLEHPLEVLDDEAGEAQEIRAVNPWLTYGQPLHLAREFGLHDKLYDILDEQPLLPSQAKQLIERLLGCAELPEPELEPAAFVSAVERALGSQPKVFDLNMNRKDNWVKPEMLKRMLNPGGGGGCSVM